MQSLNGGITLVIEELDAVLGEYSGNQALAWALQTASSNNQLFLRIMEYIHYSGLFAGAVARLAGSIALQYDLFQDQNVPFMLRDRSHEVAAHIFAAAEDEFKETTLPGRVTHRALARTTCQVLGQKLGSEELLKTCGATEHLVFSTQGSCRHVGVCERIIAGHNFSRRGDLFETGPFDATGFHLASETLAKGEFDAIFNFLRSVRPDLLEFLRAEEVVTSGQRHAGDLWVRIHTVVEEHHASAALVAANLALEYYVGSHEDKQQAKVRILRGARNFAAFQEGFMQELGKE